MASGHLPPPREPPRSGGVLRSLRGRRRFREGRRPERRARTLEHRARLGGCSGSNTAPNERQGHTLTSSSCSWSDSDSLPPDAGWKEVGKRRADSSGAKVQPRPPRPQRRSRGALLSFHEQSTGHRHTLYKGLTQMQTPGDSRETHSCRHTDSGARSPATTRGTLDGLAGTAREG